jgi:hypothetical protein
MKTIMLLLMVFSLALPLSAQNNKTTGTDIVLKGNGEQLKGKVTQITDADVHFTYTGETAEYIIKKADIQQITYASGRVETFNVSPPPNPTAQSDPVAPSASTADHHNKIAILPFSFLIDRQVGAPEVGFQAQEDAYAFLSKHSAGYTLLDPRSTNARLIKAGVTAENRMGFTMKELCDILGVEYLIEGTIAQNKGYQTSTTTGSTNTKVKRNDEDKVKGLNSSGYSSTNEAQRYDVSVSLNIYMDTNENIFNQSHKAFLSNTDGAYNGPLTYLLKRCPLYRK